MKHIHRAAVIGMAALAAIAGTTTAASAATVRHPITNGGCGNDPTVYSSVVVNYGRNLSQVSQTFYDNNGSSQSYQDSFSWSGSVTVSGSVSASANVGLDFGVFSLGGDLGVNLSASGTVTTSRSSTFTVPAHGSISGAYGMWQQGANMDFYQLNSACQEINVRGGEVYGDIGPGWNIN